MEEFANNFALYAFVMSAISLSLSHTQLEKVPEMQLKTSEIG